MDARQRLREARRIVVKVGTSTLAHDTGMLNLYRIDHLLRELADLMNEGREIILVSSGAIAAGLSKLGLAKKPDSIPEKQAVAAIGQGVLMHIYEKFFAEYGKTIGQVLLTKENAERHHQYRHSRDALLALLAMGAVPVINENDAVAVDEIKIGDNDNLSAMVATLVDADALIILSDIEGLYTANPATHPDARLIHEVEEITPEVIEMAGGAGSSLGTGGMATKLQAAQVAMSAGVNMVIASGSEEGALRRILQGEEVGTVFAARESPRRSRRTCRFSAGWPLASGCRAISSSMRAASRRSKAVRACWPPASRLSTATSRSAARCASSPRTTARLRVASSTTTRRTSAGSSATGRRTSSNSSRALSTRRSFTATTWS